MKPLTIFAVLLWVSTLQHAIAKEPPVPPGLDPGGVAVALFGKGVNYTKPTIASRLARDGEGDMIGWDFVDNDGRPYAGNGQTTRDAEYLVTNSKTIRLVMVREPRGHPAAVGHMTGFAVRTPARIFVWPDGTPQRPDWPILYKAAQRFSDRLFIVRGPLEPINGPVPQNIAATNPSPTSEARRATLDLALEAVSLWSKHPDLSVIKLCRKLIGKG